MGTKKCFLLAGLFILLTALLLTGCAVSPTKQAGTIRDHTVGQTQVITMAVAGATTHIENADQLVTAASTQPGNPPATSDKLTAAHQELGSARRSLDPVAPATAAIASDAVAAANVTAAVDTQLQKVNASWFSPRQKRLGLISVLIMLGLGVGALVVEFIAKTAGAGSFVAIISAAGTTLIEKLWSYLQIAGKTIYHLATLGLAWVGSEFGKAVAAKVATPTTPSLTPPAATA
jgi:hypothetical protein